MSFKESNDTHIEQHGADQQQTTNALGVHQYERHPLAAICPEMNAHDLAMLTTDIAAHGLIHEIIRYEGKLLDGWERYKACRASGTEPIFRDFNPEEEGDPREFVIRTLFRRKHFNQTQRAMIAALLVTSSVGFNQTSEGTTIDAAAKLASVDRKMIERARKLHRASSIVADAVANGRFSSMRSAETLCKLPEDVQRSVLAGDSSGSALKGKINAASWEWIRSQPIVVPVGRFEVVVADPPWPVDKTPYPTMKPNEIEADLRRLLEEKAAKDCHLFCWTTQAHLGDAISMIQRLGWSHKFTMTWRKPNGPQNPLGPMYTEEFVIAASKGSPIFIDTKDFKTGFYGRKGAHSEKPDGFYQIIARVTRGPRLELYARKRREGFEAHGNEVTDPVTTEPIPFLSPKAHERRAKVGAVDRRRTSHATRVNKGWHLEAVLPVVNFAVAAE